MDYMTLKEAAEKWGVTPRRVNYYCAAGRIPGAVKMATTGKGDTIYIKWTALPSAVQITIKDNGCGIHPEDLHHIFKRFYRSRFSKDTQGIGLGLPLAKAIIEAHGGLIEVESELGIGTSFIMNFPIPTKL